MTRCRQATLIALCTVCASGSARSAVTAPTPQRRSQRLARSTNFWSSAAAGGAAAAAATVVFHPVDTAKTVLQRGGGGAAVRALTPRALYRGVWPAAFSMMPACAVRMGAYEALKGALLEHAPRALSPGTLVFVASALSVVASSSVRAPLDMIKTRVQTDPSLSATRAMRTAWAGGARSLYRGAGLGLMRDVPFFGCNLLIYEQLKAAATDQRAARIARSLEAGSSGGARTVARGSSSGGGGSCARSDAVSLSPLELVLIGAAAQGIAGLVTNPADVLKTTVQSGAAANVVEALRACMAEGGVGSLMRGAGMRVAWIAPQGCIYYPAYEAVQRFFTG